MQNAIKMPSSFIVIFFHFHRNAWYLVTLLCLIYNMKLNKHSSRINLDGRLEMWCGSLVDLTWPMMVGAIGYANSSNLVKLKLVKDLNKPGMARMITKMSHTPMLGPQIAHHPPPTLLVLKIPKCWHMWLRLASQSDAQHQFHQGAPCCYLRNLSQD